MHVVHRCEHGEYAEKRCVLCDNDRLRTIKLNGSFNVKSAEGLKDIANQFDDIAFVADSSAHEVAAMAMRWAHNRILQLEGQLERIRREVGSP